MTQIEKKAEQIAEDVARKINNINGLESENIYFRQAILEQVINELNKRV